MKRCLLLFLAAILLSSPVFAARPLVTDNSRTIGKGKVELRAGSNSSVPRAGGDTSGSAVFQIKYGLIQNLDLSIKLPYSFSLPVGLGDAVLQAKINLVETGPDDGVALRFEVKTNSADTGLGSAYTNYTATAIYSREISGYRTHYNLGYTLTGAAPGAAQNNVIGYSAAVERQVARGADMVLEYYGTSSPASATGNIQIGGRLKTADNVTVDTGFSVAMNDNSSNVATIGVTAKY